MAVLGGERLPDASVVLLGDIWQAVARSKKPHRIIAEARRRTKRLRRDRPSPERAAAEQRALSRIRAREKAIADGDPAEEVS